MRTISHAFFLKWSNGLALERSRNGLFAFQRQGANDTANAPCHGGTHKVMRLLANRRENLQAVSQEHGSLGDGRLVHDTDAMEIEA
jgi:hypothetical protein